MHWKKTQKVLKWVIMKGCSAEHKGCGAEHKGCGAEHKGSHMRTYLINQ
jgi:hypothetical protein